LQENRVYGIITAGREVKSKKNLKLTEHYAGFAHLLLWAQRLGRRDGFLAKEQDSLAARLRAGDHQAAVELVDCYHRQIYLLMRRMGHSRQVSEDLTQESFLQAWQHINQLRGDKALSSWIYRIAANVSNVYLRRHRGNEAADIDLAEMSEDNNSDVAVPEDLEQTAILKAAVLRLPEKLKQTIVVHYLQQLSISEAAQAIGVRNGTFKSRLSRALEALKKQLE